MMSKHCGCGISSMGLGVGFGIASALCMLVFAWMALWTGHGQSLIDLQASMHPGYDATVMGGLVGAGWGFIEGFIFGLVSGFFYNLSIRCCSKHKESCCDIRKDV